MAATTHVAYSAGFTPSGGSLWSMTDLTDLDESNGGNVTELTTDASLTANGVFVDSMTGTIAVSCSSLAHATNAGCEIGAVGSLAVKYAKRSAGKGAVASNYLTVTYADVMLSRITRRAGVTGQSIMVAEFLAYGPGGTSIKSAAIGA